MDNEDMQATHLAPKFDFAALEREIIPDQLYSVNKAAELLGIEPDTLRQGKWRGSIKAANIEGSNALLFYGEAILSYARNRRNRVGRPPGAPNKPKDQNNED